MWSKIEKEVYMERVYGLKPLESYTDPDGILSMSCGKPYIETVWGISGAGLTNSLPMLKCEMRKEHRHQQEWDTEYFEYQIQ